jgi:hypothetical protein
VLHQSIKDRVGNRRLRLSGMLGHDGLEWTVTMLWDTRSALPPPRGHSRNDLFDYFGNLVLMKTAALLCTMH